MYTHTPKKKHSLTSIKTNTTNSKKKIYKNKKIKRSFFKKNVEGMDCKNDKKMSGEKMRKKIVDTIEKIM